jgi:hypothetical protein
MKQPPERADKQSDDNQTDDVQHIAVLPDGGVTETMIGDMTTVMSARFPTFPTVVGTGFNGAGEPKSAD